MERIQEKAHDNKEFSCESSKPCGESQIPTRERDRERQRENKQMNKNNMKKENYLNYTTIIKYAFCFLFLLFFIR